MVPNARPKIWRSGLTVTFLVFNQTKLPYDAGAMTDSHVKGRPMCLPRASNVAADGLASLASLTADAVVFPPIMFRPAVP